VVARGGAIRPGVSARIAAGTIFGADFRVVQPLGAGAMGEVYIAEQLSTGKQRALKVMNHAFADDPQVRALFDQEARVGGRIESEHVVEVVAAGVDTRLGVPWLAMELLRGEDLQSRVEKRGPLREGELYVVFEQICHAMGAAHRAGVVHRDLKPENIFLSEAKRARLPFTVKLLDFGIAKVLAQGAPPSVATGAIGTPLWMAPEQSMAQPVDARADVWALGLIAYYVVTGKNYWRAAENLDATVHDVFQEILREPLPPALVRAREYGVESALPGGFDAWFRRCVNRDLEQRFRDADEVWIGLQKVLDATVTGRFAVSSTSLRAGPYPSAPGGVARSARMASGAVSSSASLPGQSVNESRARVGRIAGTALLAALLAAGGWLAYRHFVPRQLPFTQIRVKSGRYFLTAVNGGGVAASSGATSSDAVNVGRAERFTLVPMGIADSRLFAIRTSMGTFFTAENGGGMAVPAGETLPLRTDATSAGPSEGFRVHVLSWDETSPGCTNLPPDWYPGCPVVSLLTSDGIHYLSASHQNLRPLIAAAPVHASATRASGWETFIFGPFEQ
jgi:serine/threonine protein kinase